MKKIILLALLSTTMASCSFINKDVETETNSGSEILIETITESGSITEEGKYTIDSTGSTIKSDTSTGNTSVEKNIETIVETNEETSKENATEEEILNDIDSLINDIINSAENG